MSCLNYELFSLGIKGIIMFHLTVHVKSICIGCIFPVIALSVYIHIYIYGITKHIYLFLTLIDGTFKAAARFQDSDFFFKENIFSLIFFFPFRNQILTLPNLYY